MNIVDTEKPDGVIVQFGGQTPLNLSLPLKRLGVPIIGTDPENIDLAEDRKRFGKLLDDLQIPSPPNGTATSEQEAMRGRAAARIPGAGASELRARRPRDGDRVRRGHGPAVHARGGDVLAGSRPVLIDRFLEDATEVDVDALCDGEDVLIAGIMEHIEEAGVHSGDSSCVLPPFSLEASRDRDDQDVYRGSWRWR